MIIYLARHTEYDNPRNISPFHLPVHLSIEGREKAKRMGNWFKENAKSSTPIISSPIARCVQTSEIISSVSNSFVTFDDRLFETMCPNLQGTVEKEFEGWKFAQDDPSRESQSDILKRVLNLYNEVVEKGADRIFVSHGDPLTILWFHLTGKKIEHYLWSPQNSIHNIQRGDIVKISVENSNVQDTEYIKV